MFFNAIETVALVFLMMAVVFLLCKLKVLEPARDTKTFGKLITLLTMPCTLIHRLFEADESSNALIIFIIGCAVQYILFILGSVLRKPLGVSEKRKGVFASLCAIPNATFLGLPMATGIFGNPALPTAINIFAPNAFATWTAAIMGIRSDGGQKSKLVSLETLKHLATPPLITMLLCYILIFLKFPMPKLISRGAEYFGNMTTPLSVMYIAMMLYHAGFKSFKAIDKSSIFIIISRFVLAPLIAFALCRVFALNHLETMTITVLMGMPCAMQVAVSAGLEGADGEYATRNVVLTTLCSLIVTPFYILIMT